MVERDRWYVGVITGSGEPALFRATRANLPSLLGRRGWLLLLIHL